MAIKKLSRSQKELHTKLLGLTIDHFVGGGVGNAYPQLGGRVIQSRTMEQFVSLGYVKEISRMRMTGSVEKITYEVVDPSPLEVKISTIVADSVERIHSKLRKAEVLEILEKGGFFEEVEGLRMTVKYYMGQHRLNSGWVQEWREKGLLESFEREYFNGTFRGCKWRMNLESKDKARMRIEGEK